MASFDVVDVESPWATGLVEQRRSRDSGDERGGKEASQRGRIRTSYRVRCGVLAVVLVVACTLATAVPIFAVWQSLSSRSIAQVSKALMTLVAAETLSALNADVSAAENIVERNALFAEVAGVFRSNETHSDIAQQWRVFAAQSLVSGREAFSTAAATDLASSRERTQSPASSCSTFHAILTTAHTTSFRSR